MTDDGRYLVVEIDRGVPAKRVDIVYRDLTKPESSFEVLVWGLDSRFSAIYAKGAWYVKTDYHAPNGCIMKADPGIMPDGVEDDRARRAGCDRRLVDRGREDLCEPAEGREDGDRGLLAGRQAGGHGGLRRHRFGLKR